MLGFHAVPAGSRRVFYLDLMTGILGALMYGGVYPFIGVIARKELHASPLLISVMTSASFVGFLTGPFLVGHFEKGRKLPWILATMLLARSSMLLFAFTYTARSYVAVATLGMIIPSLSTPAYLALMKDIYPDDWRGRLTALVRIGATIAGMASAILVGLLLTRWRFQVVLPIVTLLSMTAILFFMRIKESKVIPPASPGPSFAGSFSLFRKDPRFKQFCIAYFICGFGNLMSGPVITLFQVDDLKITPEWIGWISSIGTLTAALTYYYWGKVVDSKGPIYCTLLAMLGWGLAVGGYSLVHSLYGLIPIAIISGVSGSAGDVGPLNALLQFGRKEEVARYASLHYALLGIRGIIAPLLGGLLAEALPFDSAANYRIIFRLSAVLVMLGCFLMWRVMKKEDAAK
jgi:MFS family permease